MRLSRIFRASEKACVFPDDLKAPQIAKDRNGTTFTKLKIKWFHHKDFDEGVYKITCDDKSFEASGCSGQYTFADLEPGKSYKVTVQRGFPVKNVWSKVSQQNFRTKKRMSQ